MSRKARMRWVIDSRGRRGGLREARRESGIRGRIECVRISVFGEVID